MKVCLSVFLCIIIYGTVSRSRLVTPYERYHFEGVDITEMPKYYYNFQHDCHGYYLKCVRYTPLAWVCAFDIQYWVFADFPSECLLQYVNCRDRTYKKETVLGEWKHSDLLHYNGETRQCMIYSRRARNIEEMVNDYFGEQEETRNLILSRMSMNQRKSLPTYMKYRGPVPGNTASSINYQNRYPMENINVGKQYNRGWWRPKRPNNQDVVNKMARGFHTRRPDLFDLSLQFNNKNETFYK